MIQELGTVDWMDDGSTSRATAHRSFGKSVASEALRKLKAL